MEVLSLCPFRAGALAWQSAPNAWSLTVVVKATFTIVVGGEATIAPVQAPVAAFAPDTEGAVEDLSPLKPKVDVLVLRGSNEDTATIEVASLVVPARGPVPPFAPARRLLLRDKGLEWAATVLRGEAAAAGPVPEGFDFSFFHVAPREQRIDLLRTGVPLVLNGVLPNVARVETILPQRKPQAFRIHPQTGKASEIILRCDTLCVDAARSLLVLTFRGIADVDSGGLSNMGTIVVAAHSAGKKIRADRIERFLRNGEPIEGESNDGRHPLEKRYDTVLAAPKGDTMALPEMDGGAEAWPSAPLALSESGSFPAGGLPFQTAPSDAPPPPVPPAPLNRSIGGRRHGTLNTSMEPQRAPAMPFQGAPPPPVPDVHMPPPPPEGIFPPPPALLPIAPPPGPPPIIQPPAMLGASFAQDEKTADLPPGHVQTEESFEESTVDLPPKAAAAIRLETPLPPPVVETPPAAPPAPRLTGKAPAPLRAPVTTKPSIAAPKAPAAPKPAASALAPKPGTAGAPKPAALGAVAPKPMAPKPAAPKAPIKPPAPLGPKLKTDAPAKPSVATSAAEKKSSTGPTKPAAVGPTKPLSPAKPAAPPMRPMKATLMYPGMIKPGEEPAADANTAEEKASAPPAPEVDESFNAAEALTLEQCAALEAELRHRAPERKTLLEKNQLSNEQWLAIHKHWTASIARQTEVGERKLLMAYDAAYVAVQEKLGVKVGIDTHAKLQVAAERGTTATVLGELGLEPADQMRLGRVWTQRLADEPARMRELAAAIEKARAG